MPYIPTRISDLPRAVPSFGERVALLSDFNGGAENPLSESARWAESTNATGNMQITGDQVGCTVSTTGMAHYMNYFFGPDVDAYFTIPTKPSVDADAVEILCTLTRVDAGSASAFNGYGFRFAPLAAGTDTWTLARWDASSATALASGTREFVAGEKIGIRRIGTLVSGWFFDGATWTMAAETSDPTYVTTGTVGMRIRGTTGRIDDFYAGTIP